MNFSSQNSLWDITQPPSQFSQLPDDDFLALLQKQFPTTNNENTNNDPADPTADPQSVLSDDSSPSPPSHHGSTSRRHSIHSRLNDTDESALKRKASDDDMQPGPSSKNQHTADDPNPAKKQQPSRRKSTGHPQQDETRLIKRKEQNRAAQRAFRERKEKHVKDLEDKLAALEAKNDETETENSNLRDLLSRLRQENLALKQAQFTFSVPKPAPAPVPTPARDTTIQQQQQASFSFFGTPSPFPPPSGPSQASPKPPAFGSEIDWSSLTTFDPSMLNILDEPHEVPMQTDTTPSPYGQYAFPQSYKTIANNPLFMSFIDETPSSQPTNTTANPNSFDHFTFNFPSPTNSWASTAHSPSFSQNPVQNDFLHQNHSLDELFGGNFMNNQSPLDFSALVDSTSMSPIAHAHANGVKPPLLSQQPLTSPISNSNNSPPSSASTSNSQSPFSWTTISQTGESSPSASESMSSGNNPAVTRPLVLSRQDIAKHIAAGGPSPFTDLANPGLRKMHNTVGGEMVDCQGTKFPRTKESPDNIEVLKAWRCMTRDPRFKDVDINELCADLTKKARCDGTKVVLEPEGVHQIYEKFQSKLQLQQSSVSLPQEQR